MAAVALEPMPSPRSQQVKPLPTTGPSGSIGSLPSPKGNKIINRTYNNDSRAASRSPSPESVVGREHSGTHWLTEASSGDMMTSRMRDTIIHVLRQECHGALQQYIREGMRALEVQQAYLLEQQGEFMNSVIEHMAKMTDAVKVLEAQAGNGNGNGRLPNHLPDDSPKAVSFSRGLSVEGQEIELLEDRNGRSLETSSRSLDKANQKAQHLLVTVIDCDGLLWDQPSGTCDPFCMCTNPDKEPSSRNMVKTPVRANTVGPKWNYTDTIADYEPGDSLLFEIKGNEAHKEDVPLGRIQLDGSEIQKGGGFEGQLALEAAGRGPKPLLHVSVRVMQGPAAAKDLGGPKLTDEDEDLLYEHAVNMAADEDAAEEIKAEEEKKLKIALLKKIPYPPLRDAAIRCVLYMDSLNEPERRGRIAEFENSKLFFSVSMLFVVADQLVTVSATNHIATTLEPDELPILYSMLETLFLVWFAAELAVKMFVHRQYYFVGSHCHMNWLDFFLVAYSFIEVLGLDLSFLRALRVFKMAKVVRMLKALSSVRDLRVMIDCLITSWFAMFWAVVLIGFLTYMFSLIFVQAMSEYMVLEKANNTLDPDQQELITGKFGSVQLGILSLFMSLTGGFDWGEVYDLIVMSGPIGTIACLFFVTFFTISVWNIVGSIFVEKVMDTAKPHPHEVLLGARTQARVDAAEMKEFFTSTDEDKSGFLDEGEWLKIIEHGGLNDFMAARDVNLKDKGDFRAFFDLAVEDYAAKNKTTHRGRSIPVDALVAMFLRVKGPATALDVMWMKHDMVQRFKRLDARMARSVPKRAASPPEALTI